MEWEIDRQIGTDVVQVCCGEERAECESKTIDLKPDLCSYPHLWSWAVGSD